VTIRRLHRDQRGIVAGSLVRYAVVLVILGVIMIEAGSILFTYIGLQNAADAAAIRAADTWSVSRDLRTARRAARDELDTKGQDDATITTFEADSLPALQVRFTVEKQAPTLIVQRLSFLEDLGIVEVDATAQPVAPGV
jgi:Flp pilus assembly protein TadG